LVYGDYHFLDYSFDGAESGAESSEFLSSAEGVNLTPIGDNLYLSAEGNLYRYVEGGYYDNNEEYFSADGENFYNAKGEKVGKAFKSVGKGIGKGFKAIGKGFVKVGKFIGKVAKKVGRAVVKASKTVATGVKKTGAKIKDGAKKLVHHKTKEEKQSDWEDRNIKQGNRQVARDKRVKEHNEKKAKREKEIADAKAKGQTPPPPLPPLPPLPPPTAEEKKAEQNKTPNDTGKDVFTKELPPATPSTPPQNVVEVAGQKFDATDIPKGKEIVETVDGSGKKIAGVEFAPEEVVAVQGADGNIEYYTPESVSGMSKGMKMALIIGGSVLVLGIIGFIIYKSRTGKGK
ncbi:MAG: hypothetical protein WCI04_00005, partial [archaeon]